jgi:hypothetical protein
MKMNKQFNIKLFLSLVFILFLLVSCGGGGGGSSSSGSSGGSEGNTSSPGSFDPETGFTIYTIDSTGDVGMYTSIATGSVHIVYNDYDNGTLKYAYCDAPGSCNTPIGLDNMGTSGFPTTLISIGIDSANTISAGYYDYNNGDLKYASCSSNCTQPSNWDIITIDSTDDVGSDISVTVSPSDTIHISYYDFTNGNLKYAFCSSNCTQASNWSTITIDSTGDIGISTSITVDSSDQVHISYYDFTNGDLKYAFCSSNCTQASNWSVVTIDSTGDVGDFTSITVDSSDQVHISYYDFTNGNLKYAFCSSNCTQASNWSTTTVDSESEDVGLYSSISINSNDSSINISYYDSTNGDLKYAVK